MAGARKYPEMAGSGRGRTGGKRWRAVRDLAGGASCAVPPGVARVCKYERFQGVVWSFGLGFCTVPLRREKMIAAGGGGGGGREVG